MQFKQAEDKLLFEFWFFHYAPLYTELFLDVNKVEDTIKVKVNCLEFFCDKNVSNKLDTFSLGRVIDVSEMDRFILTYNGQKVVESDKSKDIVNKSRFIREEEKDE
ncbi:MAG: hypothetical protein Kapaf2KO_13470 [Candidatus Kapaibacteriales bacterium]